MNLPFPEARERLMNRIKQDNAEIKQQEKEITEMRKMIETYQRQVREITNELAGKANDNEDAGKFEILAAKEKEIAEFQQKFNTEKQEYEEQIQDNQKVIAALLEHMQKNLGRQNKLPTQNAVDEMKKDLNFKQRQLNDAEMTAAKLQIEVEARNADLDKISNLESRIDKEMETVAEGINKMEDEMQNKFMRVDDLAGQFEEEKVRLVLIRQMVEKYKAKLSQQVNYGTVKHETRKNQILQSDIYNRLNEIEKRLIGNESQIYAIQQYIEAKGAESNYQGHFQTCMQLCTDINNEVIKKSLNP